VLIRGLQDPLRNGAATVLGLHIASVSLTESTETTALKQYCSSVVAELLQWCHYKAVIKRPSGGVSDSGALRTHVMIRRRWFFPLKWGSGKRKNIFVSWHTSRKTKSENWEGGKNVNESKKQNTKKVHSRQAMEAVPNPQTQTLEFLRCKKTKASLAKVQYSHPQAIMAYLSFFEVVGKVLHGVCPKDRNVLVLHVPQDKRAVET